MEDIDGNHAEMTGIAKVDSLLSAIVGRMAETNPENGDDRILLKGPVNSGKTSLLIDSAYEETSKPCSCSGGGLSCDSIRAVVFCPLSKQVDFPLPCYRSSFGKHKQWDATRLKRIQVRHVTSLPQILQYMTKLQSDTNPPSLIAVDDLDLLCQQSSSDNMCLLLPQMGKLRIVDHDFPHVCAS